jgi:O-antigen/teichoic acid export membrane protein
VFSKLKSLFVSFSIYGLGDVLASLLSFLLLPIFARYLSVAEYGLIGILLAVEVLAKIAFRWGIDASFMRMYYDCEDDEARRRLGSTLFWFLAASNGLLLAPVLVFARPLAAHLLGSADHAILLQLVLASTFIASFFFLPFHVLRIANRAATFVALGACRTVAMLATRLGLVVGLGWGVFGVVLADTLVTAAFTAVLLPWFARLIRLRFSLAVLGEALGIGLPRIPHGLAHQLIAVADRYLLSRFGTLADVGLYSVGASFGLGLKLFLSGFEYAWAPFYLAAMKEADAARTYAAVTTYGLLALVLVTAGLSAVARPLVDMMTPAEFTGAARVVPLIALGVLLQGVYILTSIGLNITKRTRFYPLATGAAAVVSLSGNLVLIPRFGALGAAAANALSYGVLALVGLRLSQRFFPVRYETRRLIQIGVAGVVSYGLAIAVVPASVAPLVGVLGRGAIVVAAYPLALLAMGFLRPGERQRIALLLEGALRRRAVATVSGGEIPDTATGRVEPSVNGKG